MAGHLRLKSCFSRVEWCDRARALPSLCFASRAPLAVVADERIIQGGAAPGTLGPILGLCLRRLGAFLVLITNLEIILGL